MKYSFSQKDIPEDLSILEFFYRHSDFMQQIERFNKLKFSTYLKRDLRFDQMDALCEEVVQLGDLVSWQPFSFGNTSGNPFYRSISLTYNSNATDQGNRSVYHQTLGSDLFRDSNQHYYQKLVGSHRKSTLRNTLADSYAINRVVDLSNCQSLKYLLDSVQMTKIRSRISGLLGTRPSVHLYPQRWHNDESVMINLRINIPIQSSSHYGIEIKIVQDNGQEDQDEISLDVGHVYVYNTNLIHRPFVRGQPEKDRINLILGISPWWQFDEKTGYWYSNRFYGHAHPFEMFQNGEFSSLF